MRGLTERHLAVEGGVQGKGVGVLSAMPQFKRSLPKRQEERSRWRETIYKQKNLQKNDCRGAFDIDERAVP